MLTELVLTLGLLLFGAVSVLTVFQVSQVVSALTFRKAMYSTLQDSMVHGQRSFDPS